MYPTLLRWSRRLLIASAALPLLQVGGCETFTQRTLGSFLNVVPRTVFNAGLQVVLSILNGTSNFLFQSGGQFGGGFGS